MKKLLTIIFLLIASHGFSQGGFIKVNNSYGTISNRGSFDSTLFLPTGCGTASLHGYDLNKAALYYDSCGHQFYGYDPSTKIWSLIQGLTDTPLIKILISDSILLKVDNVTKNTIQDSFYIWKGLTHTALKDSAGGSSIDSSAYHSMTDAIDSSYYTINKLLGIPDTIQIIGDSYNKAQVDSIAALKANDTSVVHKVGTDTITGVKNFNNYVYLKNLPTAGSAGDFLRTNTFGLAESSNISSVQTDLGITNKLNISDTAAMLANKANKYLLPINVKDAPYNAVADGITDDRAAIQRALDSGYTQKRAVYMPSGTYLMSTTIYVGYQGIIANLFVRPGVVLYGDGESTILQRKGGSDTTGFTITYDSIYLASANLSDRNYTLKNFKIIGATIGRGYQTPGASDVDGGIFLARASARMNQVIIEGVTVQSVNKEAIAVWNAEKGIIRNNRVINCNHDAYNPEIIGELQLYGNSTDSANFSLEYQGEDSSVATIANNQFINAYEYGISVKGGKTVKILGNILQGANIGTTITGQATGIFLNMTSLKSNSVEIVGNTIDRFVNGGIANDNGVGSSSAYQINSLLVKDNTIKNSGDNAIRLYPYDSSKIVATSIIGNTIYNWNSVNTSSSDQYSSIYLSNIDSVSISNNRIYNIFNGVKNDPLYVNNTRGVTFTNNDVTGQPSQYWSYLQIKTSGTNPNLIVYGNTNLGFNNLKDSTFSIQYGGGLHVTGGAKIDGSLTVGNKINIATGTNASVGSSVLVAGTVTVSTTAVTANSKIFLTDVTTGSLTNIGTPTVGTITAGTSFVINSTNVLDASNVNWFIIN